MCCYFLPTNGEIPLCDTAHNKVGDPGHQDILSGVPDIGEDVNIEVEVHPPHLIERVVKDASDHE